MTIKVFIFCFVLLSSTAINAQGRPLRACMDHYPPYQSLTNFPSGIHVIAVKRLADLFGRKLDIVPSPNFARCLVMLKMGQADVVAGMNRTIEREKLAFFTPYRQIDLLVLISRPDITEQQIANFSNEIIGIPRGTSYFTNFDSNTELAKISIPNVKTGIDLILKNRIDAILTSNLVAETLITEQMQSALQVTVIEREEEEGTLSYFGFSKLNQLELSQEEITAIATDAFSQGLFKDL